MPGRHGYIQQQHVWFVAGYQGICLRSLSGFGHNLDIGIGVEQHFYAGSYHDMVIGEHYACLLYTSIQTFILNDDEDVRQKAVDQLFEAQTGDFYGMFKAMDGLPVIVRLLDPPLHEFLESPRALDVEIARLEATGGDKGVIAEKRALMEQIDAMAEANPMLGLRGCRLGIVYPILPVMQVRAIATAAAQLKKEGLDPKPEIMIPLVSVVPELAKLREVAEQTIAEVAAEQGVELDIQIGTMIELPRAAVTADEIATKADFFSFGTNDLTQTTFGFSRDDVEAEFIPQYLQERLLPFNPFARCV